MALLETARHLLEVFRGVRKSHMDPVEQARRDHAPTRAQAENLRREAVKLADQLRPGLLAAQTALHEATAVFGAPPTQLKIDLDEAMGTGFMPGLLDGTAAGFQDIITRIDGLTPWAAEQPRVLHDIKSNLEARKSNLGALKRLARKIEDDLKELEPSLEAARHAPPPVAAVVQPDPPAPVQTDTEFTLYGRKMGQPLGVPRS